MKVRDIMTGPAITVAADETVEVAARTLTQYNIGVLPVCDGSGKLCGVVTDRDLVIRCMAAGKSPCQTEVRDVMTKRVLSVSADMGLQEAAALMGKEQVRRLPVMDRGALQGMVSLADVARCQENRSNAADALAELSSPVSHR